MPLLLDTHAWLWFVRGDARLSSDAHVAIEGARSRTYVSIASIWEVAIKTAIGKMTWHESLDEFVKREIKAFHVLPISVEHVLRTSQLPLEHRDPFDRMLAAQAIHENLTIVSADEVFDRYGVDRLWSPPSDA